MRGTTNITDTRAGARRVVPHDLNHRAAGEAGFSPEAVSPIIPPNLSDTDGFDIGLIWPKSLNNVGSDRSKWLCPAAPVSKPFHAQKVAQP